ncbi:hypothetical protein B0H11DRAFT_2032226 [Mycena galericulata]|nr:hypothetical protein B0H11DRAFT_2032226 [Mycena galericulata]
MSTSTQHPVPIQIFIHINGGFTVIYIHPTHAAATPIPETMQPSEPTVSADAPAAQAPQTRGDAAALNTHGTAAQVPAAGSLGAGDRTVLFCMEPFIDAVPVNTQAAQTGQTPAVASANTAGTPITQHTQAAASVTSGSYQCEFLFSSKDIYRHPPSRRRRTHG